MNCSVHQEVTAGTGEVHHTLKMGSTSSVAQCIFPLTNKKKQSVVVFVLLRRNSSQEHDSEAPAEVTRREGGSTSTLPGYKIARLAVFGEQMSLRQCSNSRGVGGIEPPSSLAMNGLLIITRSPSNIHYASHVYGFLTAFGYK